MNLFLARPGSLFSDIVTSALSRNFSTFSILISGYMGFENDCYRIEVKNKMNWTSAEFTCGTEGGHLAYILNNREQSMFTIILHDRCNNQH